jgi:DNA processing protein
VEQCRNKLNLDDLQTLETSSAASASEKPGPMHRATQAVLRVLQLDAPTALDHLVEAVEGCSASEIIAILFELEMGGLVRQLPGKNFIRVWAE